MFFKYRLQALEILLKKMIKLQDNRHGCFQTASSNIWIAQSLNTTKEGGRIYLYPYAFRRFISQPRSLSVRCVLIHPGFTPTYQLRDGSWRVNNT